MESGERGLTLVSVIINLAHALKLNVVAEGVETQAQLLTLRELGCDEMQGYLFGKPVPVDTFETKYLIPIVDPHTEFLPIAPCDVGAKAASLRTGKRIQRRPEVHARGSL
jgi:hypothetical protein